MRRKTTHLCLVSIGLGLLMLVMACGDGASLNSLFSKRRGAAKGEMENRAPNDESDGNGEDDQASDEKPPEPSVWPQAVIINEDEFKYGIPNGDLFIWFQGEALEGFEWQCRSGPAALIEEMGKDSCNRGFYEVDIEDFEKFMDFRFELFAVHEKSGTERLILARDFRTDPIMVVVPEEPFLKTQYSGIGYLTLTTTTPLPVYFTCSTASEVVFDPTLDCRDGTLRLEYSRYNGTVRLRILAWNFNTNRLLAQKDFFFCAGYHCARTIHPPVSPPPY